MSIMAPFFPREAAEKGLSETLSGFVFSFYALVMFLTSPIFGKIVSIYVINNPIEKLQSIL
jgi:MFS family permease